MEPNVKSILFCFTTEDYPEFEIFCKDDQVLIGKSEEVRVNFNDGKTERYVCTKGYVFERERSPPWS
jgi:hypothetical protein